MNNKLLYIQPTDIKFVRVVDSEEIWFTLQPEVLEKKNIFGKVIQQAYPAGYYVNLGWGGARVETAEGLVESYKKAGQTIIYDKTEGKFYNPPYVSVKYSTGNGGSNYLKQIFDTFEEAKKFGEEMATLNGLVCVLK